jgi:two-component system cell cycle response regulator
MPGMEGAEVCRQVRAGIRDRYVYMMLLSVRADLEDVVIGMESGADDYIVKPFRVDELRARLHAGQRVLALQQELVAAREALREQATRDGLTGLWNRTAIFDILQNELARSCRSGEPLIVLMADLDGFKPVNDRFGHMAGDAVLRQVAARMRASVRRYDAVGRYGGEEFLMVLPGCDLPAGLVLAERIRDAIDAECFRPETSEIRLTCSLGAAWPAPGSRRAAAAPETVAYSPIARGRRPPRAASCSAAIDHHAGVSALQKAEAGSLEIRLAPSSTTR